MNCYLAWLDYRNWFYKRHGRISLHTSYSDWVQAWKRIHGDN